MADLKQVKAAQSNSEASLKQRPNVVSVGYGFKRRAGVLTNELSVIIYVKKKVAPLDLTVADLIPQTVGGVPTDVQEIPTVPALSYVTRSRPAVGGISCGNPQCTAGSVGLPVVIADGKECLLSNKHVLAPTWEPPIGETSAYILQPGIYDNGQLADQIATILRFSDIKFDGSENRVDGALAVNLPGKVDSVIFGIPTYPVAFRKAEPGMACMKVGRTTMLTRGIVSAVGAAVNVQYTDALTALFTGQVQIDHDGSFLQGGDSGSALLNENGDALLGLCFAGGQNQAFANDIADVQAELNFTLDVPPQPPETIETQLGETLPLVRSIWAYYDGKWVSWAPGQPPGPGTLVRMMRGWGYWILLTEPAYWTYHSFRYGPLVAGWNLIGFQG